MLKSAFTSPKIRALASRLGIPFPHAIGLCAMAWNFTADHAPQGDIGRHDDATIAMALEWPHDPAALVDAFVACRLFDRSEAHRLVVHDWAEHCPRYVHAKLAKAGRTAIYGEDAPDEEQKPRFQRNTPVATIERSTEATTERSIEPTTERTAAPLQSALKSALQPDCSGDSSASSLSSSPTPSFTLTTSMSKAPNASSRCSVPVRVSWTELLGWQNITDTDLRRWKAAYPAADVDAALARASAWLAANPRKRPRSNYAAFINEWLAKDHDRAVTRAPKTQRKGWT